MIISEYTFKKDHSRLLVQEEGFEKDKGFHYYFKLWGFILSIFKRSVEFTYYDFKTKKQETIYVSTESIKHFKDRQKEIQNRQSINIDLLISKVSENATASKREKFINELETQLKEDQSLIGIDLIHEMLKRDEYKMSEGTRALLVGDIFLWEMGFATHKNKIHSLFDSFASAYIKQKLALRLFDTCKKRNNDFISYISYNSVYIEPIETIKERMNLFLDLAEKFPDISYDIVYDLVDAISVRFQTEEENDFILEVCKRCKQINPREKFDSIRNASKWHDDPQFIHELDRLDDPLL